MRLCLPTNKPKIYCPVNIQVKKKGQLIGIVEQNGTIQMNYHQVNLDNEIRTGNCTSKPKVLQN